MTINPHNYLKMTGCRRSSLKRDSVIFPCSPSGLLTFCLVLVYLFSLARGTHGVALGGGPGEIVQPLPQGEEEEVERHAVVESSNPSITNINNSRVKRSHQQLCGYRLLDALRGVCNRNFVGFTRRSDPSFNDGTDGQSGEDMLLAGGNINPWDVTLMTLEYPHSSAGSTSGDVLLTPSSSYRESNSILDYFEPLPQQPPMMSPSSFPWSTSRTSGNGGVVGSRNLPASSKAIALKMLTESPKTHQRFRRNIIDECCKKPCSMNEMVKYCAITVGKRSY